MPKIPHQPEDIFEEFVQDCREAFGADLVGVILYGSGARGEYVPRKSDINFMIVLTQSGINTLGRALPLVSRWHKRRVSTPLFLTEQYIASSLDTFPIEFLNIQAAYRVVYGQDLLKGLVMDRTFLRLQCERELKGKLLQLRENFLETEGKKHLIADLVTQSLPTFFSIFQAVLALRGKPPVSGKDVLVSNMSQETGLDRQTFLDLAAVRAGTKKLTSREAVPLMQNYIEEIRKLSMLVDTMDAD